VKHVNVSGQAYGFLAMTPIKPGEEGALKAYLEGLRGHGERPLSKVPRTHMARWVVVDKFNCLPSYKQRRSETLEISSLVFSSNFDGDLDSYLDDLCEALAPEASEIWGRCIGCPDRARGAALKDYLKHNQIDCGFFYAAYGEATVSQVKASLDQRDRLVAFATRAQGMEPAELQQAFISEFAS
jgi:hypothetical protein